jgi:hypothetical protein
MTPSKPIVIKPGSPGSPSQNYPTKPVKPVPYPPGDHDHDHGHGHHHPPYCYPYYTYPVVIIPSYPSAYIGPEIVSITNYPTEDTTAPSTVPAPPVMDPAAGALQGNEATPRLIAILGRIQRVDATTPTNVPLGSTGAGIVPAPPAMRTGDGERLCLGLATLTVYHPASPDEPSEAIARGTYLGSRWDGDLWHTSATGTWSRGPVTRQPIFTLHEVMPSTWPFETARPGRRVTSMRMALALLDDTQPGIGPSAGIGSGSSGGVGKGTPSGAQVASRDRHAILGAALSQQLQAASVPVPENLAPAPALNRDSSGASTPSSSNSDIPSPPANASSSSSSSNSGILSPPTGTGTGSGSGSGSGAAPSAVPPDETDPNQTYLGNARSPFGEALAASVQAVLDTPAFPQPSVSGYQPSTKNHQLLGIAEWTLPLTDQRDIMTGCPRVTTVPLPADLQTVRTRDTSPSPVWVRPFRIEVQSGSDSPSGSVSQLSTKNSQPLVYQGEIWFLIVPDATLRNWTSATGTTLGAPLAPP